MLTISTVNVIVVSIYVSLAFSEKWAELGFLSNRMYVCAEMPEKLVDDPLVLFDLVVSVTMSRLQRLMHSFPQNLVIMRKEFESREFSDPNIDYIDEIPIPEPKRQNDDKAAKEEASNHQKKQVLHSRNQKSKSKIAV